MSAAFSVMSSKSWSRSANMIAVIDCDRSEEHTSELQSRLHLVCRLLLEKKKCEVEYSLLHRNSVLEGVPNVDEQGQERTSLLALTTAAGFGVLGRWPLPGTQLGAPCLRHCPTRCRQHVGCTDDAGPWQLRGNRSPAATQKPWSDRGLA